MSSQGHRLSGSQCSQSAHPATFHSASAYLYRAARPAEQNLPEAWVLLLQHANLPLWKQMDMEVEWG